MCEAESNFLSRYVFYTDEKCDYIESYYEHSY